jgi:hypothetical protein
MLPTLQLAIGPVILISGIGLLMLSMTNRLATVVAKTWDLAHDYRGAEPAELDRAAGQMRILLGRARLMRAAIASASVSVLFAAILIIVLFVGALFGLAVTAPLVAGLFVACMTCVIISLFLFIRDVNRSLRALKLDVEAATGQPA